MRAVSTPLEFDHGKSHREPVCAGIDAERPGLQLLVGIDTLRLEDPALSIQNGDGRCRSALQAPGLELKVEGVNADASAHAAPVIQRSRMECPVRCRRIGLGLSHRHAHQAFGALQAAGEDHHDERNERPVEDRTSQYRPGGRHGTEHVAPQLRPDVEFAQRLGRDRQDFRLAQCRVAQDLEIVALYDRLLVRERSLAERTTPVHRGPRPLPSAQRRGDEERDDARREEGRRERLMQTKRAHHRLDERIVRCPRRDERIRRPALRNGRGHHRPQARERQEPDGETRRAEEPYDPAPSIANHLTWSRGVAFTESTRQTPLLSFTTV